MKETKIRPQWFEILLMVLIPVLGMALGVAATMFFNVDQTYSNLIVNLVFLVACVVLWSIFKFSREDAGLKVIGGQMRRHIFLSLMIFGFYFLIYICVIRISSLKPFTTGTAWGLLTYLVVVFAEETYFRGMLYGFIQKRYFERAALLVSSILFGLFHARQGLSGIISRTFTGWLWGSVRYSTGMIFLLIFPIHFAYNAIWLLFEGNWNTPPVWAVYVIPVVEFLLGLGIATFGKGRGPSAGFTEITD